MAKLIYGPVVAECVSAEPSCPGKALNWDPWRKAFEGLVGELRIFESEKKSPGRPFAYFFGGEESERDWWLNTYYGEWCVVDGCLFFTTKNSRYRFRLMEAK